MQDLGLQMFFFPWLWLLPSSEVYNLTYFENIPNSSQPNQIKSPNSLNTAPPISVMISPS